MEKLVNTTEAAKILGLSLQGVHYRIKNNKIKSIKKDGKTFVYIDENLINNSQTLNTNKNSNVVSNNSDFDINQLFVENYNLLIKEKNRQIKMLQKSIKWMDKQYKSEIHRLEENQNKIIQVFDSEIKLLQSAFNEMRSVYNQEPKVIHQSVDNTKNSKKVEFITVKDFFVLMKHNGKTNNQIKLLILESIKNKDERFIYNKIEKSILILKDDFKDLI